MDSFDFNEGPANVLGLPDVEGVIKPALDVNEERVFEFEFEVNDLPLPFVDDDTVEGGERALKNCFGFRRKVRAGLRPLFCLTDGLEDGDAASGAVTSDASDMPEMFR